MALAEQFAQGVEDRGLDAELVLEAGDSETGKFLVGETGLSIKMGHRLG